MRYPALLSTVILYYLRLLPSINFSNCANLCIACVAMVWQNRRMVEISNFSLSYVESDPRTHQPSACIFIKPFGGTEMLITPASLTFVELDCEIRRLHAELDTLRAQAKKKFYKAEAAAAAAS